MKHKLRKFVFLACLLVSAPSFSQQYNIDSLLTEFKRAPGVDLRTYDQLFIALYPEYLEELVLVAEDLLTKSVQNQNLTGMHRAADAFGVYLMQKGLFNQAFKILYRSMRFYERTDNQAYLIKAYGYLGALNMAWNNEDQAIEYYSKMRVLSEKNPKLDVYYSCLNNLTTAYFQKLRYDIGLNILKENANHIFEMSSENQSIYYNLYGNYYLQKGLIDSAKHYYTLSKNVALKFSENRLLSTAYANLAICEFETSPDNSLKLFEDSYHYALLSNSTERISVSLFNIASWHLEFDQKQRALDYYKQSLDVASKANSYLNMFDALDEIAQIYRNESEWEKVDSINLLQRDIRTRQYREFMALSEDTEMLESAFLENKPLSFESEKSKSNKATFNKTMLVGLLVLVLIQFVVIVYMSLRLSRKH